MVCNTTQHPPPHTLSVYTVRLLREGGGDVREKVEGQGATRVVEPTNMTGCISSLLNASKDDN
jgi:hypothetical protein